MTQTTATLTDFLLARIAEDEKVARNAAEYGAATWGTEAQCWNFSPPERGHVPMTPDEAHHIGRHDPRRVLAECEAKLQIVGLHPTWEGTSFAAGPEFGSEVAVCRRCDAAEPLGHRAYAPCRTLRLVALPYADHPDYRDEWRVG